MHASNCCMLSNSGTGPSAPHAETAVWQLVLHEPDSRSHTNGWREMDPHGACTAGPPPVNLGSWALLGVWSDPPPEVKSG